MGGARGGDRVEPKAAKLTSPLRNEFAPPELRPLSLRGDTGRKGLLGSPAARRAKLGEDPGLRRAQAGSTPRAPATQRGPRRRRGGQGAAGAFSRGGGGDAESRICHCFSPLSSSRGLKQKRKQMRLAGRRVPELRPPPPPGSRHLRALAAGRPGPGEPGRRPAGAQPRSGHGRAAPGLRGRRAPRAAAAATAAAAPVAGDTRWGVRGWRGAGRGRPRGHGAAPARRGHVEGRGDRRPGVPRPDSSGQAEQGASGQDFFHSTFSPVSEAKGRNQDCNTGWELGVLQQFRETLEPRDESRARVKLFPLGPRKMVSLYPQTQASFTGGWWDGVLTACSPARADGSGRLHTWRT